MTYQIGEIEELTGVKANVLRYWETVIPSIAPQKDTGGRRMYTERDLAVVYRLKYLIYERKYTIEGARNQIIRETALYEKKTEAFETIRKLRKELLDMYIIIRKYRTN